MAPSVRPVGKDLSRCNEVNLLRIGRHSDGERGSHEEGERDPVLPRLRVRQDGHPHPALCVLCDLHIVGQGRGHLDVGKWVPEIGRRSGKKRLGAVVVGLLFAQSINHKANVISLLHWHNRGRGGGAGRGGGGGGWEMGTLPLPAVYLKLMHLHQGHSLLPRALHPALPAAAP